jgi:hypothetical protein
MGAIQARIMTHSSSARRPVRASECVIISRLQGGGITMRQVNNFIILACAATLTACAAAPPAPDAGKPAPRGYYTKMVSGQQMYCRNDLKTGSRVEHEGEKCYTPDELKSLQDANAAAVNGSDSAQHGSQGIQ